MGDRVPHGDVVQRAVDTYVAHRGETFPQKRSRIGNGLKSNLRRGLLQLGEGIAIVGGSIGQVGVAIDQAGQHRHLR